MPSYDRVRACPCLPMSESPLSVHVRALGLERLPPACISGETSVSPVRVCATVSLACGCVADHAYLPFACVCGWESMVGVCIGLYVCVCQRRSRLTCVPVSVWFCVSAWACACVRLRLRCVFVCVRVCGCVCFCRCGSGCLCGLLFTWMHACVGLCLVVRAACAGSCV